MSTATDTATLLDRLVEHLEPLGRVAVAFSGGVDSATLLAAAARALPGKVIALTVESAAHPTADRTAAQAVLEGLDVSQWIVKVDPLALPPVRNNHRDRCYHCKKNLFSRLLEVAKLENLGAVVEATNADDLSQHRPGLKALQELKVQSPLVDLGITKAEVRALARHLDLPVADRPSAACLLTRIPYDVPIDEARLKRIDAAEEWLHALGLAQVRLRDHGDVARLELGDSELEQAFAARADIARQLRKSGWRHVALDLEGYRSGSYDQTDEPEGT